MIISFLKIKYDTKMFNAYNAKYVSCIRKNYADYYDYNLESSLDKTIRKKLLIFLTARFRRRFFRTLLVFANEKINANQPTN